MIEFKKISLNHNGKEIFSNLDLTILKNEKVLIQGKSGIGKTTFLKLLLGFETIDSGTIYFNRQKIDKFHIKNIRKQIFYLSQDIDLKEGPVDYLIEEILEANSIEDPGSRYLNKHLNFLELSPELLKENVSKLSGGERQRIGLLICILLDRPVWLLDEPTSALDNTMKNKIVSYVLEQNKTIVIISHDTVWSKNEKMRIERWK